MRSRREVDLALMHFQQGLTATEVARLTDIPRSTVRDWGSGRGIQQLRRRECPGHDTECLDGAAYAYLLGLYLGDGCISAYPRGVWKLRITLDALLSPVCL